jgi:hypothetical protein
LQRFFGTIDPNDAAGWAPRHGAKVQITVPEDSINSQLGNGVLRDFLDENTIIITPEGQEIIHGVLGMGE